MKEQFEDRMTKKIRKVLEKYEPAYSPQAWDKLRDQIPVPVFWLKRLLLKYKFLVPDIAIVGVLIVVYNVTGVQNSAKSSDADPLYSDPADYSVKEVSYKIADPGKGDQLRTGNSGFGSSQEEEISANAAPAEIADFSPADFPEPNQSGIVHAEKPASTDKSSAEQGMLKGTGFGLPSKITEAIPLKSVAEKIPVNKSHSSGKVRNFKFQLPEFTSLFRKEDGFDKFTGPDKVALFYSPEMLHSNSSGNLGIAQGIGLSFEGAVRSSVSVSAGISFQAIAFSKTTVTQNAAESPTDTIIESGNYKYLEIPVSVNLKFLEGARSQVWFGTGLSSIIFLKQDYTTVTIVDGVKDENGSSAKGWENVLPLASWNFGLLYRYQFSYRFCLHSSFQYKLHLVPLGYNSMKLDRLNFQAGIIYRFGHEN